MRLPFFYGWVVVAVAFVTMGVGVNARTGFSLLFPPMLAEFGWDRGMTAGAFSFGFIVSAVLSPSLGRLMDRRGPRVVMEMGVLLMAGGLMLATLVRQPWQLYATIGVMVGGGSVCLGYIGQALFLPYWFVRRRGFAISLAYSGVGVGSIVILPWLQTVIDAAGWRAACWTMGLLVLVILLPINLLLRGRPQDMGLEPDGDRAATARRRRRAAKWWTRDGPRSTGRSRGRRARRGSGGSRSAISAASSPGTRCRCTRRSTSSRSGSARRTPRGRSDS